MASRNTLTSTLDGQSGTLRSETATATTRSLLMIVLQIAVFLVAAEARMIAPLLPAMAADYGISIAAAGLLISSYTLPYGLFQLVYGPLADRFSRQRVMGIALALFALGTLLSGLAPDFTTLLVLRVCTGAVAAGVIPVALAYVGDAVPYAERHVVLGRMVSIAAFGGVISAALGGLVAASLSWRALFSGYGVLSLAIAALMLRLPVQRVRAAGHRPAALLAPYRTIAMQAGRQAIALYGLVAVEGLAALGTLSYFGALLVARDHYSYGVIGMLLMLNGAGNIMGARLIGRLIGRLGECRLVQLGGTLMAVAYALVAVPPTVVTFPLAMLLSGAGFALAHSTLQARATELAPAQRGTAIALFAFVLLLGSGIGTFVAGQAIERVGWTPTLLATAAVLAIFALAAQPVLGAKQPDGSQLR